MRTKFKPWAEPYILEHNEICFDFANFKKDTITNLEIGSGKGKFLCDMATNNPDQLFIGVERNVTCAGYVAKKIVEKELNNAKLIWKNVDLLFETIPDNSIDNIFLNFSDPWPKKKHAKRRLTAPRYLPFYFKILNKGGSLVIKTDQKNLYDFSLENLESSEFEVISKTENYKDLDTFDAITEYELDFRNQGLPIYRIIARKK